MGRRPCCSKEGLNRGAWTSHEDRLLVDYINTHGEGKWRDLPQRAGLKRCGKSCRLRWLNYLRPDIKRGNISDEEEDLIVRLHGLIGNRWSLIAGRLPGRTDNEIKNYWNTNLSKKIQRHGDHGHPPRKNSSIQTRLTKQGKMETHQAIRTKAGRCTRAVLPQEEQCPMMKLGNMNAAHQDEDPLSFLKDLDMADFINSDAFIHDNEGFLQQDCGCGGPDHDHQAHDGNMDNGDNCGDSSISSSFKFDRLFALDEEMFEKWGAADFRDI